MDFGGPVGGYQERIIASADGLSLYARDYAPLQPVTGLPVFCLHGLTRNSRDFEVIAPRIAALGRRVIALDMRGRGNSANDPDPAHYVAAVYAQDVIAWMDALEIPKAVFIGTSMGGIISMVLATLSADRVAACVLNDIGISLAPEGLERIGAYVGRTQPQPGWTEAAEAVRQINLAAFPERADDADFWMTFARRGFRELEDGRIEADYDPHIALAFADVHDDPPADLTPFFLSLAPKPVLVVRGEISDLLSAQIVAEMQALKEDLDTVTVDKIGHAPLLDEPQAWDAVLDFLAKVD